MVKYRRIQNKMTKYFIICADKNYILKGIKAGFFQAGHGRKGFVSKLSKGDKF
jgi:hypothetical protein